jgi:PKD repeat protein
VDTCPVAAFTYKIMGNSAQFIPAATNAATYNWSFGTGDSSTGVVQVFTYAVPGTYPVSLTATNSLGCSNTSLQFVTIAAPNSLQSPFADFMTAYPNPFTDAISIESGEPVSVNLLTIDGRLLYQLPEASKHTISAAYLSPAIYILEVRKYQTTRRFKVQKL